MLIRVDKSQLEQVFINTFKNADEIMKQQIKVIKINYPGVGIANTDNLLIHFYIIKPKSSGIELSLCRQIMFNHGAVTKFRNRKDALGEQVAVCFPLKLKVF